MFRQMKVIGDIEKIILFYFWRKNIITILIENCFVEYWFSFIFLFLLEESELSWNYKTFKHLIIIKTILKGVMVVKVWEPLL